MDQNDFANFITNARVQLENHEVRLDQVEHAVTQISQLTSGVERLASNMEHMVKEQQEQGKRLQALESKGGEMWQKVVSYTLTAILAIIIGYIAKAIGLGG